MSVNRPLFVRAACAVLVLLVAAAAAALAAAPAAMRSVTTFTRVAPGVPVPVDLLQPEGRTRWDLTGAPLAERFVRSLRVAGARVVSLDAPGGEFAFGDPAGGDGARRWMIPQDDVASLKMGSHAAFALDVVRGERTERRTVTLETVGIGWVHLPSGPHEAVLQRAVVTGASGTSLVYRWVDPRVGIVAEAAGLAGADGRSLGTLTSASLFTDATSGAANLTIYVDQIMRPNFLDVQYGWDRGTGTTVSSLTPDHFNTIGELINASSWDFSGNNSGTETTATYTPVNSSETCNYLQCGYTVPNGQLERRDHGSGANLLKYNSVREREDRTGDSVLWLRGGSQKEGSNGTFGQGESRICFTTFSGTTRTPAPEWDFLHKDARGYYMQAGDTWAAGPFNCEQNLFNQKCGVGLIFDKLYTKACGTHSGKQSGEVLKGGVVTLPSGHTFNALLTRTLADYCVYSISGCSSLFKVDEVRTSVYLWSVPYFGSVVRLQSAQNPSDTTSYTTVQETDIKFGLFPPRSISVTGQTAASVSLSWDPGLDTHRITGYKIYWDTDSGASTAYAFNSQANPGQVTITGTSATISGLAAGTTYYLTVTSLSSYTDPSTNVTTSYESILYPTQVSGDPTFVYPVEVQATTGGGCTLSAEVGGVTVTRSAPNVSICWTPTADACATGYRILGANAPSAAGNFTPLADVGLTNCWTGNPAQGFFLVVTKDAAGHTGPWGHYGQ